jgi:hypothetical protein
LSILFGHSPLHFPEQMRFLGPLDTHNMWGFEGSSHVHARQQNRHAPTQGLWLATTLHPLAKGPRGELRQRGVTLRTVSCLLHGREP